MFQTDWLASRLRAWDHCARRGRGAYQNSCTRLTSAGVVEGVNMGWAARAAGGVQRKERARMEKRMGVRSRRRYTGC